MKLGGAQIAVIATIIGGVALLGLLTLSKGSEIEKKYRTFVDVFELAETLGLDKEKFEQDIDSDVVHNRVEQSRTEAIAKLGGSPSTPSVFIGDEKINISTYDAFKEEIRTRVAAVEAEDATKLPLVIVEYLDYACPHCNEFEPVTEELETELEGKISFDKRQLPFLTESSTTYAFAAEAAREQGKFDEYHKELFKRIHGE